MAVTSLKRGVYAALASLSLLGPIVAAPQMLPSSVAADAATAGLVVSGSVDSNYGAANTLNVIVPAGYTGTLESYLDGVPVGQAVDVNGQNAATYPVSFTIPSYGPHTLTIRFTDDMGYNPLADYSTTINTAAPTKLGSGTDYETYQTSLRIKKFNGGAVSGSGTYADPYIVGRGDNIDYSTTITVGAHGKDTGLKFIGEQGFMLPEGFLVDRNSVGFTVNGSAVGNRICTIGGTFDSTACGGPGIPGAVGGYVKPDWKWAINPVPSNYLGIQTTQRTFMRKVGAQITISESATLNTELAPGIYPTYVAMSKYDRNAITSIQPMEGGYIAIPAKELPARVVDNGADSGFPGVSGGSDDGTGVTGGSTGGGTTNPGTGGATGSGASTSPSGTSGDEVTYEERTVYNIPDASSIRQVTRTSAIDAKCQSNGAPLGRDTAQDSRVTLKTVYPAYAVADTDFKVNIYPQTQVMDGKTDGADFMQAFRMKVDFNLPDPSLATLTNVEVHNDGTGYSGTPSITRVDEEGNPSDTGTILRVSDSNLTIGNGPNAGMSHTGLSVNIGGKQSPYQLPSFTLTFHAAKELPNNALKATFGTTIRNDAAAMEYNNDKNFVTFGMAINTAIGDRDLVIRCQPKAGDNDANRALVNMQIASRENFKQTVKVAVKKDKDGNVVSETTTNADGSTTTVNADGTATTTHADGTVTTGTGTIGVSTGTTGNGNGSGATGNVNAFSNGLDSDSGDDDNSKDKEPLPSNGGGNYDNSLLGTILRKLGGTTKGFIILGSIIALIAGLLGAAGMNAYNLQTSHL
ncbi:MAG: Ig-like domain-containing protein [Corynebacterium sp.]|nr:Ig-like domain-containing protein [Corynebacterium sp.]